MSFCPGTERWDRTPDTEMPFCPRPRRFVPGQKGGTEGLEQNVPVPRKDVLLSCRDEQIFQIFLQNNENEKKD